MKVTINRGIFKLTYLRDRNNFACFAPSSLVEKLWDLCCFSAALGTNPDQRCFFKPRIRVIKSQDQKGPFAPYHETQVLLLNKKQTMEFTNLSDRPLWLLGKFQRDIVSSDDDVQ